MMAVSYTDTRKFSKEDLQELFQSVDWLSAKYPDRLKRALDHCETVFTAWDQDKLVGLINAIDDGELTAYVHYLCVNPAYQGQGIGKELLINFYSQNGFEYADGRYVLEIQNG